jgi:hypothetical protein
MNDISETMQRIEGLFDKCLPKLLRGGSGSLEDRRRYGPIPEWLKDCIVARYNEGESMAELAANLEINLFSISQILHARQVQTRRGRRCKSQLSPLTQNHRTPPAGVERREASSECVSGAHSSPGSFPSS